MKTRIHRACTFTLISLLSLFGFAVLAGAQSHTFNQLSGAPESPAESGSTDGKSEAKPSYSKLYSFCAVVLQNAICGDGSGSLAGLIQDVAGNLYGTTVQGGEGGVGTVFKLDTTGQETVLYSFCPTGGTCTDGELPHAGLIQDPAGNLYGTTLSGGANAAGTVFKVDTSGNETVIYSFCSAANCADGMHPYAGLIQDSAGNLYGTTWNGGNSSSGCLNGGCGTVFKVDTTGNETVLYSFCSTANCTDGAQPYAGLIQDGAGNLYGTTYFGGLYNPFFLNGYGTVFKLDSAGHETVLYSFCPATNCTDGAEPQAGLIQDAAGNLYGTTVGGGTQDLGTVFKLDTAGHETVLHSFGLSKDGYEPYAGLIQDAAGNLYGTTRSGGAHIHAPIGGTVFKVDNTGKETVLYSFCSATNCADGENVSAGLIKDAAGNLYGTTFEGGGNSGFQCGSGCGAVFKIAGAVGGLGTVTITLTSSPNPSNVGQAVTLSAVVSGRGATPTGSVSFEEGKTALGTVALANGQASLTTAFIKSGSFSVAASYSGDQNYKATKSKPITQVVAK